MISLIPDEFAEYALNLAETNIVLLMGIYRGRIFNASMYKTFLRG